MIFLDHIDTWCPYREQTALACWQWTFKRFFRGRIKAQWWVSEKNLEEAWFTYHSLKCPDDLAEGFTLRAAKRKVAHSHVTPLLIFQVVFPWLSENFLCHQHIRQACLWYAASNTAPGITLLLHYQTFWTFSLVSGGGGGGGEAALKVRRPSMHWCEKLRLEKRPQGMFVSETSGIRASSWRQKW